jgi:hypothetical protein
VKFNSNACGIVSPSIARWVLAGKLDDVGGQCCLVIRCRRALALRRSLLTQNPTCPSLGDAKLDSDTIHARAAAGGA